jgi:hypothetical protein
LSRALPPSFTEPDPSSDVASPEQLGLLFQSRSGTPLAHGNIREIAAFVHDVTGSKLEGASGDLGKISDALTTEALRLKRLGAGR